jgi:hypothetical protein
MQVNYATDISWTTWCETALRQLLKASTPPAHGTASVSTLGNSEILLPIPTNRSKPEPWNHPRHIEPIFVTPASRHTAPDVLKDNLVFGEMTRREAQEDDMWGYNILVSEQQGRGNAMCNNDTNMIERDVYIDT